MEQKRSLVECCSFPRNESQAPKGQKKKQHTSNDNQYYKKMKACNTVLESHGWIFTFFFFLLAAPVPIHF